MDLQAASQALVQCLDEAHAYSPGLALEIEIIHGGAGIVDADGYPGVIVQPGLLFGCERRGRGGACGKKEDAQYERPCQVGRGMLA